jgi:hypothetical protein
MKDRLMHSEKEKDAAILDKQMKAQEIVELK